MNHTTERFKRSQADVWPWHGAIEHYRRPLAERVADVVFTAALAAGAAVLAFMYLSR